jgi:glutamine synthetase
MMALRDPKPGTISGDPPTGEAGAEPAIDRALELWRRHETRLLSLMHVGGDGRLKGLDFAPRDADHVRAILQAGERADGSSLFARSGIETGASDILLRPRPETAFVDPFGATPTLAVLCGHATRAGGALRQSPDTIVRRAARHVTAETGHDLWAHGEVEFFLGQAVDGGQDSGGDDRGYHATRPVVFGQALRRRALVCLSEMGVPVKYAHSEVGHIASSEPGGLTWEQHEIELDLLPLPQAADAIVLTQWVLRNLAHDLDIRCSTEPIVVPGHPGNGLHLHLSPRRDGAPVETKTQRDELTPPARWLIGGLLRLGGALMALGNRSPHSFTRLRQGREVPRRLTWGASDRRALVRLPAVPGGDASITPTVEYRLPDGSAHPHLALAGVAQAMVLGRRMNDLDELLAQTKAGADTPGPDAAPLPASNAEIGEALARHRAAFEAGDVFGAGLIERLIDDLRGSGPGSTE